MSQKVTIQKTEITSVLNVMVSAARNVRTGEPLHEINLLTWLTSRKFKAQVDAIRAEKDEAKQKALKKEMPMVTISGTFHESRKKENLKNHSGLICIDIDADDNPYLENWNHVENELQKLTHAAYVGKSVRGNGYMVIIPIAYPTLHEEHFKCLQTKFLKHGIVIDRQCKDVSRARFYSYDDNAYFNHNAVPFKGLPKKKRQPKKREFFTGANEVESKVLECIEKIEAVRIDIAPNYDEWFSLARAFVNEFGERGRNFFHRVCYFHPGYCEKKTDKKYDAALRRKGSATIGTFFYLCNEKGITG